jgi:hypothetical protein
MRPVIKKIWTSEVNELTDRIKRIRSSERNQAKYYVFKVTDELCKLLDDDTRARGEIIGRTKGRAIFLLIYDRERNKYSLKNVAESGVYSVGDDAILAEIKQHDLNEVVERTQGDCIIDAPANAHFVTPSGKHALRFLRLTDAIYSFNALDRISYWLQPYVKDASAVVIDTWSLSSIILMTQQLLGISVPFDCFHQHVLCDREKALDTLNKLGRRINGSGPVVALVGISSSGAFFRYLPELMKCSNIGNQLKTISIFGFRGTHADVDCMARLEMDVKWYEGRDCEYCASEDRRAKYEIDSKYYYPRKRQEEVVRFTKYLLLDSDKKTRSDASRFIHTYGVHRGVLLVHKNDPNDGILPRHHAFYISVEHLLEFSDFKAEVIAEARQIESAYGVPDVVVMPPHGAAIKLGLLVTSIWTSTQMIFSHSLKSLSADQNKSLEDARHICFMDDVSITGSRIRGYLRELREIFGGARLKKLENATWFPLIMRPTSNLELGRLNDCLSGHGSHWTNNFRYLYKILLPDWSGEGECPWCREEILWDRYVGPIWEPPHWYGARLAALRDKPAGISRSPLLVVPFTTEQTLGAASALGDEGLNEIQVLFLITNGLQVLRSTGNHRLGVDDFFVRRVLSWEPSSNDEKSGLLVRFSEPLIQSCFLRAVKIDEWSEDVWLKGRLFIDSLISAGHSDALLGEALFLYLRKGNLSQFGNVIVDRMRVISPDSAIDQLIEEIGKNNAEQGAQLGRS